MLDLTLINPSKTIKKILITHKRYEHLSSNSKKLIRLFLIQSQSHMCAYCERYIQEQFNKVQSVSAHIDHIYSQHYFPHLETKFFNLVASCSFRNSCGIKKADLKWKKEYLNPRRVNANLFFHYKLNGYISYKENIGESDQERVLKTIEYLGLNHISLVEERRQLIETLLDFIQNNQNELSALEIRTIIKQAHIKSFANLIQQISDDFLL